MFSLRFANLHPCSKLHICINVIKRDVYSFGPTFTKRTQSYKERRLLGYSQEQMFDIAVDVSRYREFVPWCNESVVLERGKDNALVRIGVGFPPLSETYTSRVTFKRPGHVKSIAQNAVMFHHLVNEWNFKPGLSDNPNSCIVDFAVDFEFRHALYSNIASLFFDQVVTVMVNAFMERAQKLHGPASIAAQKPQILTYNK